MYFRNYKKSSIQDAQEKVCSALKSGYCSIVFWVKHPSAGYCFMVLEGSKISHLSSHFISSLVKGVEKYTQLYIFRVSGTLN